MKNTNDWKEDPEHPKYKKVQSKFLAREPLSADEALFAFNELRGCAGDDSSHSELEVARNLVNHIELLHEAIGARCKKDDEISRRIHRIYDLEDELRGNLKEMASMQGRQREVVAERDSARAIARVLAHAYETDNRPPQHMVASALSFPVEPSTKGCE